MSNDRKCLPCSLCCTHYAIKELSKPRGVPCKLLGNPNGCLAYQTRPEVCVAFRCAWLNGQLDLPDSYRPDLCGLILTVDPGYTRAILQVTSPDTACMVQTVIRHCHKKGVKLISIVKGDSCHDLWDDGLAYRYYVKNGELVTDVIHPHCSTSVQRDYILMSIRSRLHAAGIELTRTDNHNCQPA